MVTDKTMLGMSVAISEFLHLKEEQHTFGFVLLLVEHDHTADGEDDTPVRIAVHDMTRDDVVRLLRVTADKMSENVH